MKDLSIEYKLTKEDCKRLNAEFQKQRILSLQTIAFFLACIIFYVIVLDNLLSRLKDFCVISLIVIILMTGFISLIRKLIYIPLKYGSERLYKSYKDAGKIKISLKKKFFEISTENKEFARFKYARLRGIYSTPNFFYIEGYSRDRIFVPKKVVSNSKFLSVLKECMKKN